MRDIIEMSLDNMKKAKDFGFLEYEESLATALSTLTGMLNVVPELNDDIHYMIEYVKGDL